MFRTRAFILTICCVFLATTADGLAQNDLPSAEEIISRYITAIGGKERLESVTSMELKGTSVLSQPHLPDHPEAEMSILVSNGRWVTDISKESNGGAPRGFDGKRRWTTMPNQKPEWFELGSFFGNCSVGSSELDPIAVSLYWLSFPGVIELEGMTEIAGCKNYRLKLTPGHPEPWDKSRISPTALLFDVESGFLKQIVFEYQTLSYDDYRDVDGIMIPFRRPVDYRLGEYTSHAENVIDSIELNLELNDRLFISPVSPFHVDDK